MKTPKPKTVSVVCDVCQRDWKQHKPDAKGKVGLDECVRLLLAEVVQLKSAPGRSYAQGYSQVLSAGVPRGNWWFNNVGAGGGS